ncbi:MAG: DUF2953 domain-containing protein [Syntrophomonas sp.]|nr:DUF2953 domain-containing protein [Syntrophomonas sp.]
MLWLFGLMMKELLPQKAIKKEPSEESIIGQKTATGEPLQETAAEVERKTERDSRGWSGQEMLSIIQTQGLTGNLKRLLAGLVHAVGIRYFKMRLRIGLDDPADTGLAAGCLWSALGCVQSIRPVEIDIEPSFCQEVLEGEGWGALRIWPLLVVLPLLRFFLSMPALRASLRIIKLMKDKKQKPIST